LQGFAIQDLQEVLEEVKKFRVLLPFNTEAVDKLGEIGGDEGLFQVFPDARVVGDHVDALDEGKSAPAAPREEDVRERKELQGIGEPTFASPRALGDPLEFPDISGEEGDDPVIVAMIDGFKQNGRGRERSPGS